MNIIPLPRSSQRMEGESLIVSGSTWIAVDDPSLASIASWLAEQSNRLTDIPLATSRGDSAGIELSLDPTPAVDRATTGTRADGAPVDREAYRLEVTEDGARISAGSAEGVFRGATTLLHLLIQAAGAGSAMLEPISISDTPRFAWRGLSFDVVRTFHPVSTVKRVIDVLALYKMNVLHLHLTDSEGWRFEVPAYPNLTEVSGMTARDGRPGGWYTRTEYQDILNYAAARFITIVPEFDSPGHTASVLRAYPGLGDEEMHALPEAMRYLPPSSPGVRDLVQAVYAEMAAVHPGSRIHVGGDEAIAMDEATFATYMDAALPLARATGKGIVAWQETARAGFANGDLMQSWIPPHLVDRVREALKDPDNPGFLQSFPDSRVRDAFVDLLLKAPDDLPKALEQGANIIFSRATQLYLDTKYTEPSADPSQHADHERLGMRPEVYGNGTVKDSYSWDPATIEPALPIDRIAGIEGAIWCETIMDEHDLLFQLLPRLPGVAEKGWSDHHEWEDYRPRLAAQERIWDAMEVPYFRSSVVWTKG